MIREALDEEINYLNSLTNYKITKNAFNKILVYIDDEIKGFLDYSLMYERMEINYIYVLEKYRRCGIAYKLIDYMIKNNDFENITLEVSVINQNAINLYEKLDFKIVGKREKYYNDISAYLMERRNP